MINQKQLDKLHKNLLQNNCITRTDMGEEIKLDDVKKVVCITQDAKSMSVENWNDWYNENKDNFPILMTGLSTHLIPKQITRQMINNLDMFTKSYLRGCLKDENLLKMIITNDVYLSDLEKVADKMGNDFVYVLEFYSKSIEKDNEYLDAIPEKTKMFIAEKSIEAFHFAGKPYSNSTIQILNFIKDEKELRKLFVGDEIRIPLPLTDVQMENIRTELINNPYLSDDFKNELFNAGCNWLRLNTNAFTPEIIEEVYDSCIDIYTELYNKTTQKPKMGWDMTYRESQDMISKLIHSEKFPESMQVDLAMRITDRESKKMDFYVQELFQYTKSENVLKVVDKLKSKDKEYAYANPHMPSDILAKRTNDFCAKMTKLLNKGTPEKIPFIWDSHIETGIKNARINDEHYKMLMANGKPLSQMAMATSSMTPEYIKKEFLNYLNIVDERDLPEDYQPRVKVVLETLSFAEEENLNDFTKSQIIAYLDRIGPHTQKSNFSSDEGRNHYQVGKAIKEIDDMCEQVPRDDVVKLIDFCKEKAGKALTDKKDDTVKAKEQNVYKYFYLALSNSLKHIETMKEYSKTKNVTILSDRELMDTYKSKRDEFVFCKNCVDCYLLLANEGEVMLNLIEEIDKRDKEKKEAMIEKLKKEVEER